MLSLAACSPFAPCGEDRCATIDVPIDHADPSGLTTGISVRVRPATGDRIGPLVLNFGGPGGAATDLLDPFARGFPALAERFDLVAIDPRGTSADSPLTACMDGMDGWLETTHDALDDAGYARQSEALGAWLSACRDTAPELTAHLGTRATVADFERVRDALGGEPITYVGFSYGTILGQVYAELHPEAFRALYLDAVALPGGPYLDFLDGQSDGFASAVGAWSAWCQDNPSRCPMHAGPEAAVEAALDGLRERPHPRADGRDLTYGRGWHAALGAMYDRSGWEVLAQGVDECTREESATLTALADAYLDWRGDHYGPLLAGYFLTTCSDTELPPDHATIRARAEAATASNPLFGAGLLVEPAGCLVADLPNDPLPTGIRAAQAPTALLVVGRNDPATPYAVGRQVADTLDDAHLLTWTGHGHGALFRSTCVQRAAHDYLVDLALPDASTCP